MTHLTNCATTLGFRAILLFLLLAASQAGVSTAFAADLDWPEVTRETKPWSRWWWMGSTATKSDLTAEMEKYAAAGIGGLEITPIYGVRGYEDRFTQYLTPEWMDLLVHILQEGKRLDLGMDMATGNGWPFGGPWVDPAEACKYIVHKSFSVAGGQRLEEPVTYRQEPILRGYGVQGKSIADIKKPVSANQNLQQLGLEQVRFDEPLPLVTLRAYSGQGAILDLTSRVDADGRLDWIAPPGKWTLYALFHGWHGKQVERAGPGGEGDVIDHFSSDSLRKYLARFDEVFKNYDVSSLRAYFNDSYEVDDAEGSHNWTPGFFAEFKKRRGYELHDYLPALFGNDDAEKNGRVISDYRETISDLMLEEFTVPWRQWAESKGSTTRNQSHGSPANILDLYAASGIPETEGRDILGMKVASSAAHVSGKRLASAEAATWLDEHFRSTLGNVKDALDLFFLGGINHVCYHGTTFSPPQEEWPGWMFYASVHFGPTNSFWNDFPVLNSYVTRVQSFLQQGQPANDLLLYFPVHDGWAEPGTSLLQRFPRGGGGTSTRVIAEELRSKGYAFDYISDRQIAGLDFSGDGLRTGGLAYKAIVVPEMRLIPLATFEKLTDLAKAGATIVVHQSLPSDVPGWGDLEQRRRAFRSRLAELRIPTAGSGPRTVATGSGRILLGGALDELLSLAGVKRETFADRGLEFVRRKLSDGHAYFVKNRRDVSWDGWIALQTGARSAALFDPMQGTAGLAAIRDGQGGTKEVYLQLDSNESVVIRTFEHAAEGPLFSYWRTTGEPRELGAPWKVNFVRGGPTLPPSFETSTLSSWTHRENEAVKVFSGTAAYATTFEKPNGAADGWLLDLGQVADSARVRLNGRDLGGLIRAPFRLRIPAGRLQESNTLEIEVSNLMANRIADLDRRNVMYKKFYNINFPSRLPENRGPDGNFTAAKWPVADAGLMGPVTLIPLQTTRP